MIDYGDFVFATPPRMATTWFVSAAHAAGLHTTQQKSDAHKPPTDAAQRYVVGTCRCPLDWLASYYHKLHGGHVGVPCVDSLAPLARRAFDFTHFIKLYLRFAPGHVGRMHDAYQIDTALPVENLPWAAESFFESVGRPLPPAVAAGLPRNATKDMPVVDRARWRRPVYEAEAEYCERYDYF